MADLDYVDSRRKRQLRSFWLALSVSAALVAVGPIVFHTFFGVPWFSLRSWLVAGTVTFAFAVPAFWAAFTRRSDFTGSMALVAVSVMFLVAAFVAWRFH